LRLSLGLPRRLCSNLFLFALDEEDWSAANTTLSRRFSTSQRSTTAHNVASRDATHLMVGNYGMGNGGPDQSLVAFPFTDEDGLYRPNASMRQIGQGPDTARQERSHAHSVVEISDICTWWRISAATRSQATDLREINSSVSRKRNVSQAQDRVTLPFIRVDVFFTC